jgi:phenylalanyl-tRNA synthetase alpha chain
MPDPAELLKQAEQEINLTNELPVLEQIRVKYLGKSGLFTLEMKNLASLSHEDRPKFGQIINQAKNQVQELLSKKITDIESAVLFSNLKKEHLDITLPSLGGKQGSRHPIKIMQKQLEDFFATYGFVVAHGPEIEDDFHNFTALNFPDSHPARDMHDTFYFADGKLLRTHTSNVQIRYMQTEKPPFAVIAPGRVYRCDSDATHSPMFHQIEGFMVDKNVTMTNLKWLFKRFIEHFFGKETKFRLRPSYFPFTEPSLELDIWWQKLDGSGRWLEVCGAGMIHPNVLRNVGIDSEIYSGFAFGMGIDRLAMLKFAVDDLRLFFENDIRFLRQFV